MLNGEGNENGIKISKKTDCTCSTLFFLVSKKTNLHVQHAFCLSLPLFCTPTTLFCRTKTSNFLVTHYFYRGNVLTHYFFSWVHVRFYFSLPLIFTLLAASISHCLTAALNYHVFLPTKFVSFVFNHSLLLFLSNNVQKDTTLLLFFLSKSLGGHAIFFPNKTLSYIWVTIPVDWIILHWYSCGADGRSGGRCTVTWLPNFFRMGSLPHFFTHGAPLRDLRARELR